MGCTLSGDPVALRLAVEAERVAGTEATEHDLGRVLRLVPMGIEEITEAIAMTRADVARRGEAH